jgi:hypothetical protein
MMVRIAMMKALNHGRPTCNCTAPEAQRGLQDHAMTEEDAFDRWWEWAEKQPDSMLTIPAELHDAREDRRDRAKVNEAARQNREHRA